MEKKVKNYYEILEVDKKASPEIIEKAYKVLAKKYHPDLQEDENIKKAEEMMKSINEAYSVLSDEFKRRTWLTNTRKYGARSRIYKSSRRKSRIKK